MVFFCPWQRTTRDPALPVDCALQQFEAQAL